MKESIPNCCGNCDRAKKVSKKIVTSEIALIGYQVDTGIYPGFSIFGKI